MLDLWSYWASLNHGEDMNAVEFKRYIRALDNLNDTLSRIEKMGIGIEKNLSLIAKNLSLPAVRPVASAELYIIIDGRKVRFDTMAILKQKQGFKAELLALDADKLPAKPDGIPVWGLSDEKLGSLVVSEDGMSAEFKRSGEIGRGKISVKFDGKQGAEIQEFLLEGEFECLGADVSIAELKLSVVDEAVPEAPAVEEPKAEEPAAEKPAEEPAPEAPV